MDLMEEFEKGMKKVNADIDEMLWGKGPAEKVEAIADEPEPEESEESDKTETEEPEEGE